ncbi:MAG: UDP-N-acetylmuramoyl-L-alanine--D-glutamate ligase [Lewinellaceae bacterium]|nr:UDP-N-acetylmuramoyl-L-alanine--D-glutamate ligase [Lewinellaceae bacterium]
MKKRIVILGSGESGTGAALLAQHLGYDVFVSDKGPIKEQYKQELNVHGIAWEENQHSMDKILTASQVIKSPGIPEKSEVIKALREWGTEVFGEIEFAFRHAGKCQIVAITGSNGKTTTTELCYHLLKSAGMNVRKGGNVGNSFARMVLDDIVDKQVKDGSRIFVLEISSFQLDDTLDFKPKIAILLNITPDHLDRYDYSLEKYAASKFRITLNQGRGDKFIYNGFDPVIKSNFEHGIANREANGLKPKDIAIRKSFYKNGCIKIGKDLFDMQASQLKGSHNMFNAACALRASILLGADKERLAESLNTFSTPPHRLEKVAEINGVTWINDSKATNVDAVFYALQSMETPVVWIVGGQDKGNDYEVLKKLVKRKVNTIICMGLDNTKIIEAFKSLNKKMVETKSAEEAVQQASKYAKSGYTVLLSPACASFDLFKNYEDRGNQFKQAVKSLTINH